MTGILYSVHSVMYRGDPHNLINRFNKGVPENIVELVSQPDNAYNIAFKITLVCYILNIFFIALYVIDKIFIRPNYM